MTDHASPPLTGVQSRALGAIERNVEHLLRSIGDFSQRGREEVFRLLRVRLARLYTQVAAVEIANPTELDVPDHLRPEASDETFYRAIDAKLWGLEQKRRSQLRRSRGPLSDRTDEIVTLSVELQGIHDWLLYFMQLREKGITERDRLWIIQFHFWGELGSNVASALRRMHALENPVESLW